MIKVNKDTKIYVMCPPEIANGDPELLHQLVHKLNKFGFNTQMLYTYKCKNPVNSNYIKYNNNFSFTIDDQEQNILIVSETSTGILYNY